MGSQAARRLRAQRCAVAASAEQRRKSLILFQTQQLLWNEQQWARGLGLDGRMGSWPGAAGAHAWHMSLICIGNSTARTLGQLDAGQRSEAQEVIGSPPEGQAEASIPMIYRRNRGRTP